MFKGGYSLYPPFLLIKYVYVVEALTDFANLKDYIKKMRKHDPELNA
jgi:hypothetical protein